MKKPDRRTLDLVIAGLVSLAIVVGVRIVNRHGADSVEVTIELTAPESPSELIRITPGTVTVQVTGSSRVRGAMQAQGTQNLSFTLPSRAFEDRPATIDLLEFAAGSDGGTRRWLQRQLQLPFGARVDDVWPRRVQLDYVALTEHEVPVEVDFSGTSPPDKTVSGYTVQPVTVTVLVPEGELPPRVSVGPINRSTLTDDTEVTFAALALPPDSNARFAEGNPAVTVDVTVAARGASTYLHNVPVQLVGGHVDGYSFMPPELTIHVRCDANVDCNPDSLRGNVFAAVDTTELSADQQIQLAQPRVQNLPPGVSVDSEMVLNVAVTSPSAPAQAPPAQSTDPEGESPAAP